MYACPEEGCSRSFKRSEHLSRHRLNHQPRKIYQCLICHKDFVRLDLLQRHRRRHERGIAYRNSGGYSNKGTPDKNGPVSPAVHLAASSDEASSSSNTAEPVELRGQQQQQQSLLSPTKSQTSASDHNGGARHQHGNHQVQAPDFAAVTAPGQAVALDDPPPPQLTGDLTLGDRADVDHLTFFHGSNDITGLSQDLNWLLGIGPWDVPADLSANNVFIPPSDPTSWSPASENSQASAAAAQAMERANLVPREKVLSALTSLPPDVLASSFFETSNLQWFMQSYWHNYNPHFSLLHKPTFSVQDAPPLLLVAILTLGATLSPDPEHYRTAETIHQTLRWLIVTSPSFEAPAPLWVVQALLVVQSYEKMFSTRKLHEMAHIFHYSVITLMRRGSSYSAEREEDGDISSTEKRWHRWVERELSYRAAYFAFVMDAQHSSIFGHSAALSLTDIQLPLPCADSLWDAPTAASWSREQAKGHRTILFLPALRSLLARQPVPHTYSPFARFVLLHGLLCLTRHMITRDQTASWISVPDQHVSDADGGPSNVVESDNWRDRLDRAIDVWSFSLLSRAPSLCLEAARPLQRIAHVCIHVTLLDFHILAGAPNLATGARSQRGSVQFERAYKRIAEWASNHDAKRALSHCLLLIQETMFTRTRYSASEDNIVLKPWILYNTTLVLWAYGAIKSGSDDRIGGTSSPWTAEEYLAHMLNGLMGDGEAMELRGANNTAGLISAVRDALDGSRWELLEEAKDTLARLPEQTNVLLSMAPGSRSRGGSND